LETVHKETKFFTAFKQIESIAQHYNLFKDLFEDKFFRPCLDLQVEYGDALVFYGNKIETKKVKFMFIKFIK
jgi:hypothetical protein